MKCFDKGWLSEFDTVLDIQKIMVRLRHQEGRFDTPLRVLKSEF